ncbi:hypothetical protein ACRAWD_15675 [Caulobacter segnis]
MPAETTVGPAPGPLERRRRRGRPGAPIEGRAEGHHRRPPPATPSKPPETKNGKAGKNKTSIHLPGVNITTPTATAPTSALAIRIPINSDGGAAEVKVNKERQLQDGNEVNVSAEDEHEGDVTIKGRRPRR